MIGFRFSILKGLGYKQINHAKVENYVKLC